MSEFVTVWRTGRQSCECVDLSTCRRFNPTGHALLPRADCSVVLQKPTGIEDGQPVMGKALASAADFLEEQLTRREATRIGAEEDGGLERVMN
jgi:hypothetical protein